MNYKDKAAEARELIKEVFKDVMIENTGRNDRFIFRWGEHHCECGPLALERDAVYIDLTKFKYPNKVELSDLISLIVTQRREAIYKALGDKEVSDFIAKVDTMQSQTPVCHGKEMDFITNENEWICTECCKWQGEI